MQRFRAGPEPEAVPVPTSHRAEYELACHLLPHALPTLERGPRLHERQIAGEHLLLGLLEEGGGVAAEILHILGLSSAREVHARLLTLDADSRGPGNRS